MRIRPMRPDDVETAERLTSRAFGVARADPSRWRDRAGHVLAGDPAGCWIADADGAALGVAMSTRRDLLWVLTTYAVDPAHQGQGAGRALLDAAVGYGAGCLRGLICAMPDHRALRRYRLAGFALHPTMRLDGIADRSALPVVDAVREGTGADRDFADSVDRQVRGAARGDDHDVLRRDATLLVCDVLTGRGYAYVDGTSVGPLAATTRTVAQRLLWAALARTGRAGPVAVRYLTADQDWAIDVGLAAGLVIGQDGYLALRHMRPPAFYVPSVSFG
jgi:ribosomal protein S18 acetylase RimI-like enzyme